MKGFFEIFKIKNFRNSFKVFQRETEINIYFVSKFKDGLEVFSNLKIQQKKERIYFISEKDFQSFREFTERDEKFKLNNPEFTNLEVKF